LSPSCFENQLNCCEVRHVDDGGDDDDDDDDDDHDHDNMHFPVAIKQS
jgi:hypothetical protein